MSCHRNTECVVDVTVEALAHRCRNQIQTMTSLAGLMGRRMPEGPGRDAFADLRARFEAIGFDAPGDAHRRGVAATERLAELIDHVRRILDPRDRHRLEVRCDAGGVGELSAAAVARVVVELMIEMYRQGFGGDGPGTGLVVIEPTADGGLRLAMSRSDRDAGPRVPAPAGDPGGALSEALARALGAGIVREASGPLAVEVLIPAGQARR